MTDRNRFSESVTRGLVRRGYIPAGSVREHLNRLAQAGIVETRLAAGLSVPGGLLHGVRRGHRRFIHKDIAAKILAVDVADAMALYRDPIPYVDDIVVEQALAGRSIHVESWEKGAYARALYDRGMAKGRIVLVLGMSGATLNKHLAAA
ncbi:hypothetical protein [Nocardia farcinica]|uniref:hypothetical protein n=1 Tax=Nocardia farcinica TaxID=37329 RepID=UPI002457429A|nr:hypothetical protein [Nocardia farcinica]